MFIVTQDLITATKFLRSFVHRLTINNMTFSLETCSTCHVDRVIPTRVFHSYATLERYVIYVTLVQNSLTLLVYIV